MRLNPKPGERILDLAPGTGWTSRRVARKGATTLGIDIAPGLLEVARDEAIAQGLAIDYQRGDAEQLPFAWGPTERLRERFGRAFDLRFEQHCDGR